MFIPPPEYSFLLKATHWDYQLQDEFCEAKTGGDWFRCFLSYPSLSSPSLSLSLSPPSQARKMVMGVRTMSHLVKYYTAGSSQAVIAGFCFDGWVTAGNKKLCVWSLCSSWTSCSVWFNTTVEDKEEVAASPFWENLDLPCRKGSQRKKFKNSRSKALS